MRILKLIIAWLNYYELWVPLGLMIGLAIGLPIAYIAGGH